MKIFINVTIMLVFIILALLLFIKKLVFLSNGIYDAANDCILEQANLIRLQRDEINELKSSKDA